MQISLNIIDILCLHIFFWIRSNSRITFIVFWGNYIYKLQDHDLHDPAAHKYNSILDGQYINQFPKNTIKVIRNSNGSKRKYVDIKCLLCLMKFALTKKCCLNIHTYIYIYIYIYIFPRQSCLYFT